MVSLRQISGQQRLERVCDGVLLRKGLQAQPHLRHRALVDRNDAVTCGQQHTR